MMHRVQLADGSDGRQAIENAFVHASHNGVDPERFWLLFTDDIDWTDNPGRLIGSRIRSMTNRVLHNDTRADRDVPVPPRVITGADPELALWMESTYTAITGNQPIPATPRGNTPSDHRVQDAQAVPAAATVMGAGRVSPPRCGQPAPQAAPAGADVMFHPNGPAYTGQRAVAAIGKVREIDQALDRIGGAIDAAETALASGEDVPDNLPQRVAKAKHKVDTLTKRRAELTENLPHPSTWDAIEARQNSRNTTDGMDTHQQVTKPH
ncbi:hypothetical protein QPX51_09940 [Corynebacterium pseudodiphtheriticum]|uniref:hypothetical protein n=1 Tax=Corynebacterium pseudodiphtheriticum TaxID=37637 RepID=UPI00253F6B77|nr:hypothetical protein [Corynebacterium pseudodiphtheriticum]MDK4318448.1 hypothetical protein [Corynebacterium pseudodiphtheriticum]MDK4340293.1 hypothetical protein [Corynebacterium pseudodiphtheriticum]